MTALKSPLLKPLALWRRPRNWPRDDSLPFGRNAPARCKNAAASRRRNAGAGYWIAPGYWIEIGIISCSTIAAIAISWLGATASG